MKDTNSEIDEDAVHVIEGIFRGADWSRSKPQPDKVGLDMRVDLLENHHPQISFYLQIKGIGTKTRKGEVQPIESKTRTINKSIELEHLDYYMKLPVPVFLVLVDVVQRVAYYVHIQRYINEALMGDKWGERLLQYKTARESGVSGTPPTKAIKVSSLHDLADIEAFKFVVQDAKGYMASLSVNEGIIYKEEALRRMDDRFNVKFIRDNHGDHFQFAAKEFVEMKMRGKMPKEKFEAMFGKGLPVELEPGELTIEGSPIWEQVKHGVKSFQMKQQNRGYLNIVRFDNAGQIVARLEYLNCDIEGGHDEWRLKTRFPLDLVTFGFNLDLCSLRDNLTPAEGVLSTFTCKTNFAGLHGRQLLSIPTLGLPIPIFHGIDATTQFLIEFGLQGTGRLGIFRAESLANEVFSWIGTLYETLNKAREVAEYFKLKTCVPVEFSNQNIVEINFLHDLILGREVASPRRFSVLRVCVSRESLPAILSAGPIEDGMQLVLNSDADFPFLGETVRVENLEHVISNAKMITRKSDINRRLKASSGDIPIRFTESPNTFHVLRLAKTLEKQ